MQFYKANKTLRVPIQGNLDREDHERIIAIAVKEGVTRNEVVRQLIKAGLAQYEKEKDKNE